MILSDSFSGFNLCTVMRHSLLTDLLSLVKWIEPFPMNISNSLIWVIKSSAQWSHYYLENIQTYNYVIDATIVKIVL